MKRGIGLYKDLACEDLQKSIDKLYDAQNSIDCAMVILACSKWAGKTRISFEDFLKISQSLIEQLLEVSDTNNSCIKKMFDDADDFISNNKTLKNLEK